MAANSRYFIIRADGSTATVTADQLSKMRQSGFLSSEDRIIQVPEERSRKPALVENVQPLFTPFSPATDDLDTAPFESAPKSQEKEGRFSDLNDLEIEQAFSFAQSQSLYQLKADAQEEKIGPESSEHDSLPQTQYDLRFSDGLVKGPFDAEAIKARILEGTLDGSEQVSLTQKDAFLPIKNIADFHAAFKLYQPTHRATGPLEPYRIGMVGLMPLLLRIHHQLLSGWLSVHSEGRLWVISFGLGKILNVRTPDPSSEILYDVLGEILGLEEGEAYFDADSAAASDWPMINEEVPAIVRNFLSKKGGFSLARLLKILGDPTRFLQPKSAPAWLLNEEELTDAEKSVQNSALAAQTIQTAILELVRKNKTEDEALATVCFVMTAGFVTVLSDKETHDVRSLSEQLMSMAFLDLLSLELNTADDEVMSQLNALKNRVWETTKPLSVRDPLRVAMRARMNQIFEMMLDPAHRYAVLKLAQEGGDLRTQPERVEALKKEFLQTQVLSLLEKGKYKDVLKNAEKYYRLDPQNPKAIAPYLLSQFFAQTTPQERSKLAQDLKRQQRRHADSLDLSVASGVAAIEMRDYGYARKMLKRLEKVYPNDSRVLQLQQRMNALGTAEQVLYGTGPIRIASIAFLLSVTAVLTLVLWAMAVDMGLGRTETLAGPEDSFALIRGTILLVFAAVGFGILHKKGPLDLLRRLAIDWSWMGIIASAGLGIALGGLFDSVTLVDRTLSQSAFWFLMVGVLMDGLYFNAFLSFDIFKSISSKILAVLLLSLIYSGYYATYYEMMQFRPSVLLLRFAGLFLVLAIPKFSIQALTKSVVSPIVFQLFFLATAYGVTHLGEAGWLLKLLNLSF